MHASFSPYTLPKEVIRCALTTFFLEGDNRSLALLSQASSVLIKIEFCLWVFMET